LLAIAGWLIGTSLVGAEWQAGTMTTLLTWEPRRFWVLVAKTLAAAIGVFVMILALELVFTGLMALVAATRGSTAGTDASLVRSIVGLDVRVAAVAAVGGVLGLALATVTRNTAAALGVAFVYLAIVEGLIRGFWEGWRAWLLGDNATIFVLAQNDGELGRTLEFHLRIAAPDEGREQQHGRVDRDDRLREALAQLAQDLGVLGHRVVGDHDFDPVVPG